LVDGKLNAKFVEYMMGLPNGWVTDLDLSRAQQLKMLGNGVVPQQAYYALELLHE
jgi:DNA (cytosine-5)-methyltransferase 1